MPGTAQLNVERTKLIYQQSTVCTAELRNGGRTVLRNVNPRNHAAGPTLVLTNRDTGMVTRHHPRGKPGGVRPPADVPPGQRLEMEFMLTELVAVPEPGTYDLQAAYEWNDGAGSAISPSIQLEITPSRPQYAHIVTPFGGAAPRYLAVWLNEPDPGEKKREVWLAHISTSKKPMVTRCTLLAEATQGAKPYLSVPPNAIPRAQWVGWVDAKNLTYLVHQRGSVSDLKSFKLPSPDCRIIPPLLQNPPARGKKIPGADVLLYERAPDGTDGTFFVLRLAESGCSALGAPLVMSGPAPRWAETAYLSSDTRHTFFVVPVQGGSSLRLHRWSSTRTLAGEPKELASLNGDCIAGALWITAEDVVRGAVLTATGSRKNWTYTFHKWSMQPPDTFVPGEKIPLALPRDAGIQQAVLSVDVLGKPYALVMSDAPGNPWFYCAADGTVRSVPQAFGAVQNPAQVVFRRMEDPTILYAAAPRGFQFAKPE